MINFEDIDSHLESLGKDRVWLSEVTGRSVDAIRSALAPAAKPKSRSELLQRALSDAIEREEASQRSSIRLPDQLTLAPTAEEFNAWCRAYKASPAETLKEWAIDYLNKAADEWAKQKAAEIASNLPQNLIAFELPFLGSVAAGEPVSATLDDTVAVSRAYPPGHFVVQINGHSGEPQFKDGERWIIDGRDCFTPKKGKPCVVSDGYGSYLKKWNPKRQAFESISPAFNDVIPLADAKLQGYPVERLE